MNKQKPNHNTLNPNTTMSSAITNGETSINNDINTDNETSHLVSRRGFLRKTAIGLSGVSLASTSISALASSSTNKHLKDKTAFEPIEIKNAACISATIPTRLFASSNKGTNEQRGVLGLQRLKCAGFDVKNPEVIQRQYLRFAGTDAQRISDLQNIATGAVAAPKLLLGVRGGYGAMRLLEAVDWSRLGQVMQQQGTIMAGFSDVTAIQCVLLAQGNMSSLSAPMAYSEFGKPNPDKVSCQNFVEALTNPNLVVNLPNQNPYQSSTSAYQSASQMLGQTTAISGTMWGGNLSMLSTLAGSKYLPKPDGGIVFLEDVGEQPYRIERNLYSLYLSGAFKAQQAIVLGAFSRMGEDTYDARYDFDTVIAHLHRLTGLPIYTGFPFGHVAAKHSFPIGAMCQLKPTSTGIQLQFSGYPTIKAGKIYTDGLYL